MLAVLLLPMFMQGQTSISSPYSRFALGRLTPNNNILNMAMGGTSIASRNPLFVNPENPASYTAFDSTSFVFDGAFLLKRQTLSNIGVSSKTNDASLGYITMGFPVAKWWKSSFGVMPFSSVGYLIGRDTVMSNLGKVEFGYTGNGGLVKAYLGNAFQPFKNLSVGFNLSYIFGSVSHESTVIFPDSANMYSTRYNNSSVLKNLNLDFGLQYHITLKNGTFMVAGLTYSPKQSLHGLADELGVSFLHNYSSNLDQNKDTVLYVSGSKGDVVLPANVGGGLSFGRVNRWTASADVKWQKWSDYTYFGNSEALRNDLRISVGGQYKPSPLDIGKFYKRVTYRAGLRYELSYLELRNTRLNEFGVSMGVGLPMKKSRSTINIAMEAGTYGTTNNGLISESYLRFSVGVSLYDKWFLKRKFD